MLKKALKIAIASAIGGILVLFTIHISPYSAITESILQRSGGEFSMNSILSGRLSFWEGALMSVFDSPVLGLGPDGFRYSEGVIPKTVQPHSSLIQLIVEFGWLGAAIIIYRSWSFIAPMCKGLGRNPSSHSTRIYLVAFLFAYLIYSLVDGLFYHVLPMVHLAFIMPLLFAFWKNDIND